MTSYAHPDVLVSTDWVARHGADPHVRVVEVDVDTSLYQRDHLPGAIAWSWKSQLADQVRRDVLSPDAFARLMTESGISSHTTVILYGDNNNWFAAWAFWQMKLYDHRDVRIMDGGRRKWEQEKRPMTSGTSHVAHTTYRVDRLASSLRAMLPDVQAHVAQRDAALVDVRGPQEFSGEILAPPGLPETCQRGGHIPGAVSVPWSRCVNEEDGTFKTASELREIYRAAGITGERPIITYCRIGERSSHSWFVLKYLLGHDDVRNYDGSWTEWGNLVGAPVAVGAG